MIYLLRFVLILFLGFSSWFFCLATTPDFREIKTKDGKTLRAVYWSSQSSSSSTKTILLLQGMGGYAERYQETAEKLVAKGYNVWTLDWRGQGGSERLTAIPTLLHLKDFSDYHHDLDALFDHISPDGPVEVIATSMGGHIALRYAHSHPERFKSLILLAPMIEIKASPLPIWGAKMITRCIRAVGQDNRFVFFYGPHDYKGCVNRFDPKKHGDRDRFSKGCHILEKNPHLATGGPSFGWVAAALDSCETLQDESFLSKIPVPTLLLSVKNDHQVNEHVHEKACSTLQNCSYKQYQNAPHTILQSTDSVLEEFWQDFEVFTSGLG